jgi:outer membrane lipoprotein-sorting protein
MKSGKSFFIAACAFVVFLTCLAEFQIPTARAQGAPDAKKRGGEILADAAAAAGGDSLKKIETLTVTTTGSATTPMGTVSIESKAQVAYPDRVRLDTSFEGGSVTSAFDGKGGWFSGPMGIIDAPAELNVEALRGIDLVAAVGLYKKTLAGKSDAEFTGEKDMAGQKTAEVEWTAPSGKVKLYFDPQTKLLVGAKYRAVTMQGTVDEERRWSDFREVGGVKIPYHWITYRDGAVYTDLTVSDVKVNEKIEASTFAKPQ